MEERTKYVEKEIFKNQQLEQLLPQQQGLSSGYLNKTLIHYNTNQGMCQGFGSAGAGASWRALGLKTA